ncbi:hypothetical protein [Brevibacterium moorei]|uniref:hypothetical protein n=1 Tax=Brevibacterium moorei TaxID=2968457 RepID=UPI00211BAC20|nr:hypothetical protein [Brevibacterium sp. 68QC2CO]MCQ9384409.1 hypothetical protein [Brevibacterium sp. 68QC2CO]
MNLQLLDLDGSEHMHFCEWPCTGGWYPLQWVEPVGGFVCRNPNCNHMIDLDMALNHPERYIVLRDGRRYTPEATR